MRSLLIALLIVTVLLLTWGFQANEAWDDAYITFQYSRQVTNGAGIVYFPGDLPSQGSTSMLFTLMIGAALRLGIGAEIAAFVFNGAGILMMVGAAYLFSRSVTTYPLWRSAIAVLPVTYPLVFFHQSSGMETNFWTGLVLLTAALLTLTRTRRLVALCAVLSFAICLSRPDSALFVGVWWLALLIENRRQNFPLFAGFVAAGLVYLACLLAYFGDIFPTSFYVKIGGTGGAEFVAAFLSSIMLSPLVIWGAWTLRRSPVLRWTAPIFLLVPFFLFAEPVNPGGFRFFHPVTVICAVYVTLGMFNLAAWVRPRLPSRLRPLATLAAAGVLLFVITYPLALQIRHRSAVPAHPLRLWSHALAGVSTPISVAYGDAGMLPFFSGHRLIDFVGLTEPVIAHEARERGAAWVIEYVLDQQPDLIGFYVLADGHIFNGAHGVVGTAYSDLYQTPEFQAGYAYVGALDYSGFYCVWFARTDSPALTEIEQVMRPLTVASMPPIIP